MNRAPNVELLQNHCDTIEIAYVHVYFGTRY